MSDLMSPDVALLWQISRFSEPIKIPDDSLEVGFWRADLGEREIELGRRA
jgi:hypothetical protein